MCLLSRLMLAVVSQMILLDIVSAQHNGLKGLTRQPLAILQCREFCRRVGGCSSLLYTQSRLLCQLKFDKVKEEMSIKIGITIIENVKAESFRCATNSKLIHRKSKSTCVSYVERVPGKRAQCRCKKGWLEYSKSCYKVFSTIDIWSMAKKKCEKKGAYLAEINTAEEHDVLKTLAKKFGLKNKRVWIGGKYDDDIGTWQWTKSGEKITSLRWCPGEPDNGGEFLKYLMITGVKCRWNLADETCYRVANMVCESSPMCDVKDSK